MNTRPARSRTLALATAIALASLLATRAARAQTSAPWAQSGSSGTSGTGTAGESTPGGNPGTTDSPAVNPAPPPATNNPTAPAPTTAAGTFGAGPLVTGIDPSQMDPRALRRARRTAFTAARLHVLNSMLSPTLASRGRASRIQSGVTNAIIGTGLGVLGYFAPSSPYDMRPWFYAQAVVAMLSAGIDLIWTPAREILPGRYAAMPVTTGRERRARVRFGEQALDTMAADGTRRRLITGLTRIAASLAMLLIVYRDPLFNGASFNPGPFDYMIILFTGVDVITNLVNALSTTEEERLPPLYQERVRQIREEQDAMFGITPGPGDSAPPSTSAP